MFSLFKKKAQEYPTEQIWTVARMQNEGDPMSVRRNSSAALLARHPEYRHRVGIAVPIHAPNADGFPEAAESEQLDVLENLLRQRLEHNHDALHVLTITTGAMREFIFYSRNPVAAHAIVNALCSEIATHELQCDVEDDPKWDAYKVFD